MQDAAIIRDHAKYLMSFSSGLSMFEKAGKNCGRVLREQMMELKMAVCGAGKFV